MRGRRSILAPFAFLFTFFTGTAIAQQCSHVNGVWHDSYGFDWYLYPFGSQSRGDLIQGDCEPFTPWPAGGLTDFGFATLWANNPQPSDFCAHWVEYEGAISRGGCRGISGTWNNYFGQSGEFSMTKTCEVPDGETTSLSGGYWYLNAYYVFPVNVWNAGAGNLSGRYHRETDYQPAIDECWFETTPPEWRVEATDGSVWVLDEENYFEDTIGMGGFLISYYRDNGRAPCSVYAFQRMQISCGDHLAVFPWQTVQSQVLWMEIGTTTIRSGRGSVVTNPHPYP